MSKPQQILALTINNMLRSQQKKNDQDEEVQNPFSEQVRVPSCIIPIFFYRVKSQIVMPFAMFLTLSSIMLEVITIHDLIMLFKENMLKHIL